jgi:hypothetical protein
MKEIKDHVARLRYKPHLTDYKDEIRHQVIEELERKKEEKKKA